MEERSAKQLADHVIEAVKLQGTLVLYPTAFMYRDENRKDKVDTLMELWGSAGTFRTLVAIRSEDAIEQSRIVLSVEEAEEVADELGERTDLLLARPITKDDESDDTVFCFWSEDNPYPGVPD